MYLRFVIPRPDPYSGHPQGVIHAASALDDAGRLDSWESEWFARELAWLNEHLPVPGPLRDWEHRRAICWFRPTARKPIAVVRSIVTMLRDSAVPVRMLRSRDPGIVIYEDDFQVVAKPRRAPRQKRQRRSQWPSLPMSGRMGCLETSTGHLCGAGVTKPKRPDARVGSVEAEVASSQSL